MSGHAQEFTTRQVMNRPNYEMLHFSDNRPLNVAYHNHDFYEVYYFISGKVSCVIEGKTYYLRSGDILLINDKEVHRSMIELGRVYERIVLWIHPNYIHELEQGELKLTACFDNSVRQHNNLLRPTGEMYRRFKQIYDRLETAYASDSYGSQTLCRIYLTELLVMLNKAYFDRAEEELPEIGYNHKIGEIIHYINDNLCGDLSLDTLAREFYVSKYHLSRQFKQNVGFTLHQYVLKKRLVTARAFLQDGEGVANAFIRSGFSDYSNFSRSFKEEFGCSPKKYLQGIRENIQM